METNNTMAPLAVFVDLATLPGPEVFAYDDKGKTPESTGRQFHKVTPGKGLHKGFSKSSWENTVKKVEIKNSPVESQECWDGFDTITINTERFEGAAINGNINFWLLNKNVELQITDFLRLNRVKSYLFRIESA